MSGGIGKLITVCGRNGEKNNSSCNPHHIMWFLCVSTTGQDSSHLTSCMARSQFEVTGDRKVQGWAKKWSPGLVYIVFVSLANILPKSSGRPLPASLPKSTHFTHKRCTLFLLLHITSAWPALQHSCNLGPTFGRALYVTSTKEPKNQTLN